jgi:hypothetical protein
MRGLALLLVSAMSVAAATAATADPITFQGLSGSSTFTEVRARFPGARPDRMITCQAGEKSTADDAGRTAIDCDELEVPDFEILDMKFDVEFIFGKRIQIAVR